jgi:hypothetical protein
MRKRAYVGIAPTVGKQSANATFSVVFGGGRAKKAPPGGIADRDVGDHLDHA